MSESIPIWLVLSVAVVAATQDLRRVPLVRTCMPVMVEMQLQTAALPPRRMALIETFLPVRKTRTTRDVLLAKVLVLVRIKNLNRRVGLGVMRAKSGSIGGVRAKGIWRLLISGKPIEPLVSPRGAVVLKSGRC